TIAAVPSRLASHTRNRIVQGAIVMLIALTFLLPNGLDIVRSLSQDDPPPGELVMWGNDPWMQNIIHESLRRDDPGGAGEFLQRQQDTQPPFRFIAYGGMYHPDTVRRTYPDRRLEPAMVAILQNARAMRLNLETTQGYNPLQPLLYQQFIRALNGQQQDYHYANLLHTGVDSPLLDLLNVRYIVVDRNIPRFRDDHRALAAGRPVVYQDQDVIIYENPTVQPRAWMVYEVQPGHSQIGLARLANGDVDGAEVAFVQEDLPSVSPPEDGEEPQVTVADWRPDGMTLDVSHSGEGLLVVSQVYAEGWEATVDGEAVEVLQTDHALLGIPVGPGQHTVEVRYDPDALTLGLWISGLTAVGSLGVVGYAGWTAFSHRRECQPGAQLSGQR
ncbi:MAG TPA: YfhO family protein, partial [Thermomicrobiales bacterium]|nr:YfhO family protein [Thermomicrobiales bacterium]